MTFEYEGGGGWWMNSEEILDLFLELLCRRVTGRPLPQNDCVHRRIVPLLRNEVETRRVELIQDPAQHAIQRRLRQGVSSSRSGSTPRSLSLA